MADEHASLVQSVLLRLGRNILMFQQIESGLKLMLPYMHPKGSNSGDDAFASFRDKAKQQTLGKLVESFLESVTVDGEALARYMERMVKQRNQLVHHFYEMPGVSLLTVAGCRAAMQVLDDQHREAQPLQDLVQVLGVSLGESLTKEKFGDNTELVAVYTALKQQLPAHVEYINLSEPYETNWPNTRIVCALQQAELETEPVHGMTSLARAGAFLRSLDADLIPQTYGVGKLKRILLLSEVFDVVEHRSHAASRPITLYRSKPGSRLKTE
ncbi:hypothetical protein JJQ59_04595 [Cupriavidus necator]|uniref:hypothetical protein n=1 Tax=Cupriavidus necator TaxID=106590 RepID=UPI00167B5FF8|nr:hypothetical protein [Cupriavidus necator]QQX85232.1 hypothetical protein JJQ59_04595 [Cupriavidus necator]